MDVLIFTKETKRFNQAFEKGETYIIQNAKVSLSNKNYGNPKNDYKLNF